MIFEKNNRPRQRSNFGSRNFMVMSVIDVAIDYMNI